MESLILYPFDKISTGCSKFDKKVELNSFNTTEAAKCGEHDCCYSIWNTYHDLSKENLPKASLNM